MARPKTHGLTDSRTYKTWVSMRERCTNPNNDGYYNYGGAGISVCARWMSSFEAFWADMGERPPNMTLDRIDSAAGYSPENCRWATPKQQANNMRTNRLLTLDGETKTMSEWAEAIGIRVQTLHERIKRGWDVRRALTQPVQKRAKSIRAITKCETANTNGGAAA
jgi:hypothetical protein